MYAYAHTPLDEDTINLTSFSSGDKFFAFKRGFYGLKGLPNFFTKQMSSLFKTLIEQGFALVYIDDNLLLSDSKNLFSRSLKSNSLDMKLVTIQLNQFIQKLQLFIKSLLLLAKLL